MEQRFRAFTPLPWLIGLVAIAPVIGVLSPAQALSDNRPERSPASPAAAGKRLVGEAQLLSHSKEADDALAQLDSPLPTSLVLPDYTPEQNGFQFSNGDLTQVMRANQTQPDLLQTFDTTLQELFGARVCVGADADTCVLTKAAQNWLATQIDLMTQGLCDGIAATSLFLWQPNSSPELPWWRALIQALTPFRQRQVEATNINLLAFVANQTLVQGLDEVYLPTQEIRETLTPNEILVELATAFQTTPDDPYTIGIYRQQGDLLVEGHSLLPYRIEAASNNQYRVYVYDSNLPPDTDVAPYILFDRGTNTWSYRPAGMPGFTGNARSKNLDLTRLSWRRPPGSTAIATDDADEGASRSAFTCPFCLNRDQPLEISLIGEGTLTVSQFDDATQTYRSVQGEAGLVPFRGGLYREVPASYVLSPLGRDRPFKVTITGTQDQPQTGLTLHVAGSGYTAGFEALRLEPGETLTMYVAVGDRGPALTFEAQQDMVIPTLSIYLEDDYTEPPATTAEAVSATGEEPSQRVTEYQKHVSYSISISDAVLPEGRSVGLAVDRILKRFYFADNDDAPHRYTLTVNSNTKERQVTTTETREDSPSGIYEIQTLTERRTLRYEEALRVGGVELNEQMLAYFDYGDWAKVPTEDQIAQQTVNVPITYVDAPDRTMDTGALSLRPESSPTRTRLYRGNWIKSNYRFSDTPDLLDLE